MSNEALKNKESLFDHLLYLYKPVNAFQWLQSPQPLLEGRIPEDMLRNGDYDEVLIVLKRMNDGAFI